MAAHLIDVTEVAAAGGTVRFYQPGTLTQANVFSNDAATIVLTQPVSLDQNGKTAFPVYSITPVRAIYFDSSGAQVLDTERANGERAEIASLVNTRWPSSATVDAAFTNLAISLGATNGNSAATFTGATTRTVQDRLQDYVSVKDFGCKGDGVTLEDAAFAAAVAFVSKLGKSGVLHIPAGTYLFAAPVPVPSSGATNAVTLQGDGIGATVLRASSFTASNLLDSSSSSFTLSVRDLTINNSSSSSGVAINNATSGNTTLLFNLDISGFRTGIVSDGNHIFVNVSTDSNAASSCFFPSVGASYIACTNTLITAGAVIRVASGKGANGVVAIGCKFAVSSPAKGILFAAGHLSAGGTYIGNSISNSATLIDTTGDTRGVPGATVFGNYTSGTSFRVLEAAASTDIINNPVAGTITLNLSGPRYIKSTLIAATAITWLANSEPYHDEEFTLILQNGTGGAFAITAGANTVIQTGGFNVAATSQSVIKMQFDSNAGKLIQVVGPMAMAVT